MTVFADGEGFHSASSPNISFVDSMLLFLQDLEGATYVFPMYSQPFESW